MRTKQTLRSNIIDSIDINVRVITGASHNKYIGEENGRLKFRLSATPVKGKANKALINLISKALRVPKRHLMIISGDRSPLKTIRVKGLSYNDVKKRLER